MHNDKTRRVAEFQKVKGKIWIRWTRTILVLINKGLLWKGDKTDTINEVTEVFQKAYEGKKCRVISALCRGLMACRKASSLYIKEKWERKLKEQITEEERFTICKTQCTATNSRIWRVFNWKDMARFFITPKIRKELASSQQPLWRSCRHMDVDHTHIFWSCQKMKGYWDIKWRDLKQ